MKLSIFNFSLHKKRVVWSKRLNRPVRYRARYAITQTYSPLIANRLLTLNTYRSCFTHLSAHHVRTFQQLFTTSPRHFNFAASQYYHTDFMQRSTLLVLYRKYLAYLCKHAAESHLRFKQYSFKAELLQRMRKRAHYKVQWKKFFQRPISVRYVFHPTSNKLVRRPRRYSRLKLFKARIRLSRKMFKKCLN